MARRDPHRDPRGRGVAPTSSSGSPARPRRTSPTRSMSWSGPGSTARTRSSTRRARARGRRRSTTRSRRRSSRSASTGWSRCRSAISLERRSRRSGATFEVLVEGAGKRGRRRRRGPGPTGSCISPTRSSRGRSSTRGSPAAHRAPPGRRARCRAGGRGRLTAATPTARRSRSSVPRRRARPRLRSRSAERLGAEIVSVDSMLVYRGMDVGTAKPSRRASAPGPAPSARLAEPSERFSVARFQAPPARRSRASRARPRVLLVGGSVSTSGRSSTTWSSRRGPGVRSDLRRRPTGRARLRCTSAWPRSTRSPRRRSSRATCVGRPGPRGCAPSRAGRSERSPTRGSATTPRGSAPRGSSPAEVLADRIATRVDAMLDAGWLDEVRSLVARGFGAWLTATQAIGYAELAAIWTEALARRGASSDGQADEGAGPAADGVVPPGPSDPVVRRGSTAAPLPLSDTSPPWKGRPSWSS